MRHILPIIALSSLLMASSAMARGGGGFFAGAAEGLQSAEELELQRRALEIDRMYGTDHYRELRRDKQMRDLQRAIDENNRLRQQQFILNPFGIR